MLQCLFTLLPPAQITFEIEAKTPTSEWPNVTMSWAVMTTRCPNMTTPWAKFTPAQIRYRDK